MPVTNMWRLSWHKLTAHDMAKGAAKRGRASVGRSLASWTTLLLSKELKMKMMFNHPIQSMYGVFTYIWLILLVLSVARYTIHGCYGHVSSHVIMHDLDGVTSGGNFSRIFLLQRCLNQHLPNKPPKNAVAVHCSLSCLADRLLHQDIGQQHDLWG